MSGLFSHLRRISTIRSGKNIKFLTPAVYTGGWCPMRSACNICEDIAGISYLMVGMPECGTFSRSVSSLPEGKNGELRRIYALDAEEVVFGARKGVIDALRVMDKEGPKAIMMIATCVTDLIGEDFEGIIAEAQPELKARLSYVTLGQFKNFTSPSGTWRTAEALGNFMTKRERVKNQANALYIVPWPNRISEVKYPLIVGALEKKGVEIRKLSVGAKLEDYFNAPDAAMNLSLSSYTQPLAAKMEREFNIPYAPLHRAFTVEDIDKSYDAIAQAFGIRWNGEFDDWREAAIKLEERAKKELPGLKYVMLPNVDMPAALARYLASFKMEPMLIHIDDFHQEDMGYAKELKALGFDPPICRMMNIDRDIEIVRDMGPDISFGYLRTPIEGFRCAEQMDDFFSVTGYERTAGILSRIFTVLETGKTGKRFDIYGPVPV